MKRDSHLISRRLQDLKDYTFYRQRFDACPHFMFFVGDAHGSDTNHSKYSIGQRITCARFSRNRADWYHIYSELDYTAKEMMKLAQKDHKVIDTMVAEFKPWEEQFYALCLEIKETKLSLLSQKELLALYQKLALIYVKKLNSSPLIDGFALATDKIISEKIDMFLKEKGLSKKFIQHFETLTAPTFLSFLQQEELDFLKVLLQIEHNPAEKKILLRQHQEKYFWIHNNYVADKVLSLDFFKGRSQYYTGVNLSEKIKELETFSIETEKRKRRIIQELALPKDIITLLYTTDKVNYWQDERKKGTFWATHYFSLLLKEIEKRTSYTLEELKYTLPPEIEAVVLQKIEKKELQRRFQDCFLVFTLDHFDIITDTKMIEEIIKSKEEVMDSELRGLSVSLGKAVGKVKVVESVHEIGKVEKGDILVAVMTRPDYIPAMEKAAAFVTDEGGLTCHAAIVARELGVPCIVGTKNATKVLKDGMLVEINANHGWVKILK